MDSSWISIRARLHAGNVKRPLSKAPKRFQVLKSAVLGAGATLGGSLLHQAYPPLALNPDGHIPRNGALQDFSRYSNFHNDGKYKPGFSRKEGMKKPSAPPAESGFFGPDIEVFDRKRPPLMNPAPKATPKREGLVPGMPVYSGSESQPSSFTRDNSSYSKNPVIANPDPYHEPNSQSSISENLKSVARSHGLEVNRPPQPSAPPVEDTFLRLKQERQNRLTAELEKTHYGSLIDKMIPNQGTGYPTPNLQNNNYNFRNVKFVPIFIKPTSPNIHPFQHQRTGGLGIVEGFPVSAAVTPPPTTIPNSDTATSDFVLILVSSGVIVLLVIGAAVFFIKFSNKKSTNMKEGYDTNNQLDSPMLNYIDPMDNVYESQEFAIVGFVPTTN